MTKKEFLTKLFEKSGIDTHFLFDRDKIIQEFGIVEKDFDNFANYWVDKDFLHGSNPTTDGSHLTLFFNSSGIDHAEKLKSKYQLTANSKMEEGSIKIFVSHKSSDVDLATALVKLFISSLDIKKEEIRCTSVPGYRFDPGINTTEAIRKEVDETEILVGLLTPHSLQSSYVLFELGARWGLRKPLIPLLANGADFDNLPAPIRDNNAVKLQRAEDIYDLI